jgi:hypothetical protein
MPVIGEIIHDGFFLPVSIWELRSGPRSGRKASCLAFRTTNARQGNQGQRHRCKYCNPALTRPSGTAFAPLYFGSA